MVVLVSVCMSVITCVSVDNNLYLSIRPEDEATYCPPVSPLHHVSVFLSLCPHV